MTTSADSGQAINENNDLAAAWSCPFLGLTLSLKMRIIIIMGNLWNLKVNQRAVVSGFNSQLSEAFQGRLSALGFRHGQPVCCIGALPFGGPRIFQIGDSVFSLAGELACGIIIDKLDSQP
jgi:Fe2+ transport system protein FeoA